MGLQPTLPFLILTALLPFVHLLEKPPNIITPNARSTRYLNSRDNLTLSCKARGNPKPTYYWTLNGVTINETNTIFEQDEKTGHQKGFTAREEGNYQCFAVNTVRGNRAVTMSPVTTVRQARMDGTWKTDEKLQTVEEGQYVKLTCDSQPECVPKPLYSWQLVENTYTNSNNDKNGEIKETDRIHIDNEGTLHFVYVTPADESGTLQYKCGLHNRETDTIKLGSENEIIVVEVKAFAQSKPTFKYRTENGKFWMSKNAELECVFAGKPVPNIEWKFRGKVLSHASVKYSVENHGRKLIVKTLKPDDEGTYTCKGENQMGHDKKDVFLNVISGPIWVESIKSQTVPEGTEAVFRCLATSLPGEDPVSTPIWFRNGEKLALSETKYFDDDKTVLTVKNVRKNKDIACFQCNVSNEYGYEFSEGCLNIVEAIRVLRHPKPEQVVTEAEIVNLTIVAETDPDLELKYRWHFNEKVYEDGATPPHVISSQGEYYINTSALNDDDIQAITGNYYIELYHDYESVSFNVTVLEDNLPEPTTAQAQIPFWIIALCAAMTIFIIVMVLISMTINRKKQEGTYYMDKMERANHLEPERDIHVGGFQTLSRAQCEDGNPGEKSNAEYQSLINDLDDDDDDDDSLHEYDGAEVDVSKFTEDGSFIGIYAPAGGRGAMGN